MDEILFEEYDCKSLCRITGSIILYCMWNSFFMPQKSFNKPFEFLLYKTNRLHFSVHVYCNRSQKTSHHSISSRVVLFCSLHAVTSSVIYYSTHTWKMLSICEVLYYVIWYYWHYHNIVMVMTNGGNNDLGGCTMMMLPDDHNYGQVMLILIDMNKNELLLLND